MSLVDDPRFTQLKISGRLPTPKGVALQVITLTQQADASTQQLAHLIGADPALSLRVIKAANVLLANSSRPVVTISDAVMVLGLRGLRQLVLSIAMIVDYRHGPCKPFDYPHFWTHSLLTGIAAKHLAQHTRLASVDEIFVAGLFCHIGQLAMATVFTEEYAAILSGSNGGVCASEREKFGFDEAQLSEAILADMNFPKIFQLLVRHCDQPEGAGLIEATREWRLLHLMNLAVLLAEAFLSDATGVDKIRLQAQRLAIATEELVEIIETCLRDWSEWSALLSMSGNLSGASLSSQLQSAALPEAVQAPSVAGHALRVLVVEDDTSTLRLLQSILENAGHSVVTAKNGVEALKQMRIQPPQLVVSDWMMPEMDGLALCRALRASAEWRHIYLVILTAQENPDKLVEAFEAGADDYLIKPVTPKIFFARLRAAQRVIQMQADLALDQEKLQSLADELTLANRRLQQLALTDALTGLPNRRAAIERLEQEWSLAHRSQRQLVCMVLDVDHFKKINDKYGHPVGDQVLKEIAQALRQAARSQDLVCRFGGEEFLVICPDTDIQAAYQCAERLRAQVWAVRVAQPLNVTISIGMAAADAGTLDELLVRADRCLYEAKQAGRNCTVFDQ